jgi:ABC-type lipoprotein release transport system permease subunit
MNSLKLGFFLAKKSITHNSKWITASTVLVIFLLFLAVMVISGILVGLIQGSEVAFKEKYFGDVIVSPLEKKTKIERVGEVRNILDGMTDVKGVSARYLTGGTIEANYKTRKSDDMANKKSVSIRGINPEDEEIVTKLSDNILEGEYLKSEDAGRYVLVGKDILAKYSIVSDVDSTALRDVEPGTKIRLQMSNAKASRQQNTNNDAALGNTTQSFEYIIKGIVKVKAGDLSSSVFMVDSELRKIAGKSIDEVDEIAIRLVDGGNAVKTRDTLKQNGFDASAEIKTFEEGTPAFVINLKNLFTFLGNFFGGILIVVASVTLFIVIFINALTKSRQIGIMKGIGIRPASIIWSYVFQSIFFTSISIFLVLLAVFFGLAPLFVKYPIDFPFSDGILVAEQGPTTIRVIVLLVASIFAGIIPAWMVVRRNTLNAILGR